MEGTQWKGGGKRRKRKKKGVVERGSGGGNAGVLREWRVREVGREREIERE